MLLGPCARALQVFISHPLANGDVGWEALVNDRELQVRGRRVALGTSHGAMRRWLSSLLAQRLAGCRLHVR